MNDPRLLAWLREYARTADYRHLPADELWARVREQDDALAFRVVVERLGPRVYAICRAVLQDRHLAEDALQETLLILARKRRRIRGYAQAQAWVRTTAYLTARHMRRNRLRKTGKDAPLTAEPAEPFSQGLEADEVSRLTLAMLELPQGYRRALERVYWDGLTHAQAAEELGWSKGKVDSYVARGLEKLRVKLGATSAVAVAGLLAMPAPGMPLQLLARFEGPLPALAKSVLPGYLILATFAASTSAVGAGMYWRVQDRDQKPPAEPPQLAVQKPQAPPVAEEPLEEINRRHFERLVRSELQAALDQLVENATASITKLEFVSTRIMLEVEIRYGITTRLWLAFDMQSRERLVLVDIFGNGHYSPIVQGDRVIVGSPANPTRSWQLPGLTAVCAALERLPREARAVAIAKAEREDLAKDLSQHTGRWKPVEGTGREWTCHYYPPEKWFIPWEVRWGTAELDGSSVPWVGIWRGRDGRVRIRKMDDRGDIILSTDGTHMESSDGTIWSRVR